VERLPAPLFFGFAVSSIGGPLALISLYGPGAISPSVSSAGFTTALGALLFAAPLLVWLRYSREIASPGGLFAFVEAAVGRRVALAQGAIWILSYFLYLPYTVAFVVYDLLPVIFPGIVPYRPALELLVPLALVLAVFASLRGTLAVLLLGAALQLALMLVLGGLQLAHVGVPLSSFVPQAGASSIGRGAANVTLLFVCASLPLFLAGEVAGGARTVRISLASSFLVVSAYLVFAAFPLSRSTREVATGTIAGFDLARAYGNRPLAVLVGLVSAASVVGLILAEYVALSRLLHAMLARPVGRSLALVAGAFLAGDALSLIDPDAFYEDLLRPSLVALYLSQLIVFAAYPLFRKRRGRLVPTDLAYSLAACGLMVYGLYTVAANQLGGT